MSSNDTLIKLEMDMMATVSELEKCFEEQNMPEIISLYENLEDSKKSVLAESFNKQDRTLTDRKREMLALEDTQYLNHLASLRIANKDKIRVKLKYEVLQSKLEVLRSIYSGEKSRINIL